MAISKIFNGNTIRIPGNWGGITAEQKHRRNLRMFLDKLKIKSASYGFEIRLRPGPKL